MKARLSSIALGTPLFGGISAHAARDFISDRIRDSFSPNLFELHPCIRLQEWKRGGRHAAGGHGGDRKRNYAKSNE
jgi:hypothetical protein